MQLVVDSLLTSYSRSGPEAARPVLVLHGWGDSSRGWRPFAEALVAGNAARSKKDALAVYSVDLPGFGGSDMPPTAWGLDEYAVFVSQWLKKLGITPYAIIGHSNGGAIAIRGLASGELTAERLVLLASAGVRSEYKGRTKAIRLVAKTGKALVMPLPARIKQRLRRKLYTAVGSDMLVAENLQATFKRVVNDDVQADAAQLSLPTLLVYGEHDVSTPPSFGRLLHGSIAGSTLEMIDAGHFVHQDQPEQVVGLTQDFLR